MQTKNGGAEGGRWLEKQPHREAGEESIKVGWTGRKNGKFGISGRGVENQSEGWGVEMAVKRDQ